MKGTLIFSWFNYQSEHRTLSSLSAGLVGPPCELAESRCVTVPGSRAGGRSEAEGLVVMDLFQCRLLMASRKSLLAS